MDWMEREKVDTDRCCSSHPHHQHRKGHKTSRPQPWGKCTAFFFRYNFLLSFHGAEITFIGLQCICNQRLMLLSDVSASLWHRITCHGFYCFTESSAVHVIPGLFCGALTFSLKASAFSLWLEMLILFSRNCHGRSHSWSYFGLLPVMSSEGSFLPFTPREHRPAHVCWVRHTTVCVCFGTKAGVGSLIRSCGEFQSEFF